MRDARTGWWEALKWAARLRALRGWRHVVVVADDRGHFRPASSSDRALDHALEMSWLLSAAGLARIPEKK